MPDLHIDVRENFGLVSVIRRRGIAADRIGAALGIETPAQPRRTSTSSGLSLIGVGAGHWLAQMEDAPPNWAEELRERLSGLASTSDQSSGYAIFRLAGIGARTVLQRGLPVDLHPDAFASGSVATSVIAHIGAIVWQLDDAPTYEVAIFRSLADSFFHWLNQSSSAL